MIYDGNGFERLMEIKMSKLTKKQVKIQAIYNKSVKTKAELRAESDLALKKFLKAGGTIEVGRKPRDRKSKMACKNSRGFTSGTGGFATGFPRGVAAFK